jgi:polysaccharide biosynthesis transport protein
MSQDEETGGLPPFLGDPRGVLRRRWPWLAGVAAVGLIATAIYVSQMPVTFLASATLVFNNQKISNQFVANTVDNPMSQLDALIGEILSRDRFAPLVEKHHLYPELRAKTPMAELVAIARGNVILSPGGSMVPNQRGSAAAVFTISFRDQDPMAAAAMANDLATLFTAAAGKATGDAARTTADFMRAERDSSERRLRDQERLVKEFKEKYRGELPAELSTNTSKLERIAMARQTLATQLDAAETRLADIEKLGDLANPSSPYSRLSALRSKLVTELAANTEEHPNVIALRRQIEALEKDVAGGAKPSGDPAEDIALRDAREGVVDLRVQIERLTAEAAQLEERVSRTPQREEDLAALTQKQTVLYETYISNLRKLEAAELALSVESAQQGSRVDVLERAAAPSEPERTRLKYLLMGFAASILGAVAVAMLLELIDPVIVSAQQIEDEVGLPVLGSIGHIG